MLQRPTLLDCTLFMELSLRTSASPSVVTAVVEEDQCRRETPDVLGAVFVSATQFNSVGGLQCAQECSWLFKMRCLP